MTRTGLDRLLARPAALDGRAYGLLSHAAAVDRDLRPAHLALAGCGRPPRRLFAPEHGLHGVEQDMVAAAAGTDPWTGLPVVSLYGDDEASLRPPPEAFAGLDLLVVDLQDVGARYYTYAATAVWAAAEALAAGLEVWVLDRPNPLGGEAIEGPLRRPGYDSFVGAFELPVRHGLTLGELATLELSRATAGGALSVWELEGWQRSLLWSDLGRPWIAPSPNLPTFASALVYPGACLLEGTELSEGRGTTRPFELVGAPDLDAPSLATALAARALPGARFVPALFKPQYQKHAGRVCAGVQWLVEDARAHAPVAAGVEVLAALRRAAGAAFSWRREAYEFERERPAIDLLAGTDALRLALENGDDAAPWIAGWEAEEEHFRRLREPYLLYPEEGR